MSACVPVGLWAVLCDAVPCESVVSGGVERISCTMVSWFCVNGAAHAVKYWVSKNLLMLNFEECERKIVGNVDLL